MKTIIAHLLMVLKCTVCDPFGPLVHGINIKRIYHVDEVRIGKTRGGTS